MRWFLTMCLPRVGGPPLFHCAAIASSLLMGRTTGGASHESAAPRRSSATRARVRARACTGGQQRALAAMHGRTLVAEERELTGDRRAEEPQRHAPGRTAVVGGAVRRQLRHVRSRKCFFAELRVRIFLPGGRPRGRCHVDRHARGIDAR